MKEFTLYTSTTIGSKSNSIYPTAVSVSDIEALRAAVRYDHVCAKYKDNRRSNGNFEASDCVTMDCDNDHSDNPEDWITFEKLEELFDDISFLNSFHINFPFYNLFFIIV